MSSIFILDRNIIIEMEKENKKKKAIEQNIDATKLGSRQPNKIKRADECAKKNNFVSPLISIFEGQDRRVLNFSEYKESSEREVSILKDYYKNKEVTVDVSILKVLKDAYDGFTSEWDLSAKEIIPFIGWFKEFVNIQYDQVASDDREKLATLNFESCKEFLTKEKVHAGNQLGICLMSACFGNKHAKGIVEPSFGVKPTEGDCRKVAMDMFSIHICNFLRAHGEEGLLDCVLVTEDGSLSSYVAELSSKTKLHQVVKGNGGAEIHWEYVDAVEYLFPLARDIGQRKEIMNFLAKTDSF